MSAVTTRTQEEILARFTEANDMFGWRREALMQAMTAKTISQAMPGLTPEEAADYVDPSTVESAAREYLAFAVNKIVDHRGISASRSVEKLTEYAWLLGRDDVVAAMAAAGYAQYGAPQVRAFAEGMGWDWLPDNPADREALELMSIGQLCHDECAEGCGV